MLKYGVAVPKGAVASAPEAAMEIADRLGMVLPCVLLFYYCIVGKF